MTEPRKRYPKSYRVLLDMVVDETGYDEDYIVQLLKDRFGTFKATDTTKYLNYVVTVKKGENIKGDLQKQVEKRTQSIPCPICGAKTTNPSGRRGRYTKWPYWTCSEGGEEHFLQDKTNKIVTLQNKARGEDDQHPIPFPFGDWEAKDEDDTGDDGGGGEESGLGRHGGDTDPDTRMDVPEPRETKGVPQCAPTRLGEL